MSPSRAVVAAPTRRSGSCARSGPASARFRGAVVVRRSDRRAASVAAARDLGRRQLRARDPASARARRCLASLAWLDCRPRPQRQGAVPRSAGDPAHDAGERRRDAGSGRRRRHRHARERGSHAGVRRTVSLMRWLFVGLAALVLAPAAGGGGAGFSAHVTNPWFPLRPGTTLIYHRQEGRRARPRRLPRQRIGSATIAGAPCVVVNDRLYLSGKLRERTTDWYSQDARGNVLYFGEETAELDLRGRVVSIEGPWQAGEGGARPGVFMPAHPRVGQSFAQEHAKGVTEDHFRIVSVGATRLGDARVDTARAGRARPEGLYPRHRHRTPSRRSRAVTAGPEARRHPARGEGRGEPGPLGQRARTRSRSARARRCARRASPRPARA